uniref:Uncharacterized protein n=1 Tax=Oryza sativa subsp. japonica TaxID=39947 RepID=Q6K3C4_ORYSJ|nr:hypothetical protein [Oryza sativa Japonica Group]
MVDPIKPQVNAWEIINDEVEQTYIAASVLMQIDDAKPTCQMPVDREYASGGAADLVDLTSRPHWEGEAAGSKQGLYDDGGGDSGSGFSPSAAEHKRHEQIGNLAVELKHPRLASEPSAMVPSRAQATHEQIGVLAGKLEHHAVH